MITIENATGMVNVKFVQSAAKDFLEKIKVIG